MANKSLDQVLTGPRKRGCSICGKPTEAHVVVMIRRGYTNRAGTTKSRSKIFCSRHAVQIFNELTKQLS